MNSFTFRGRIGRATSLFAFLFCVLSASAQVTTSTIAGTVTDGSGEALIGATVVATHVPSGTRYGTATNAAGRYTLPAVRVGGPFTLTVTYTGFESETREGLKTTLGNVTAADFQLRESGVALTEIAIISTRSDIFSSKRTGASTNINEQALKTMPTLGRSLNDFLRLTPQSRSASVAATTGAGVSFAGQDSRYNNLTIDGSIFNNSFGLASAPAGQTNSTPISLDAIEEIQVNIAPYDVRQGGFVGAGVNAVTRSGTNNFEGSIFYNYRSEKYAGDSVNVANESLVDGAVVKVPNRNVGIGKQNFVVKQTGFRFGGPLIKDKLFFFLNGELERRDDPATQFKAYRDDTTTPLTDPNVTRVKASDLDNLKQFLIDNFRYDPGRYENYPLQTYSDKILAKIDYNINEHHRVSLRYNYLKSYRDVLASNSGVVAGNRSLNKDALNFEASNYIINNNIHSFIAEVNSTFGSKLSNNFQAGFTANRDFRGSRGGIFPLVDILENGLTYTTFGYEPFTPNNILNTDTWQVKDDISLYLGNHTVTAGVNFEYFKFDNTFTPTYYGQFVYSSLADFLKDAAADGQDSVKLRRYQLTYSALEGGALPSAITKAYMPGFYLQEEYNLLNNRLKLIAGVRADIPFFGNTARYNAAVDTMVFADEDNNPVTYSTDKLPNASVLFSPRFGFNWDVLGNRHLQIRGGTGIFSGRPAFVWLSNQVGNNGVLTGSFRTDNTYDYPFSNDVTQYIPANATSPTSYNLALTDADFKFPQVWRSNLAVDVKLPFDIAATAELMYSKGVNEVQYINANQVAPSGNFAGADNRPFFPGLGLSGTAQNNALRIIDPVTDAIVLKNGSESNSKYFTLKLERQFSSNFYVMAAYNYAEAKDIITAGSIAFSSWRDNRSVNGNNRPDLAFSDFDQRHRVIGALSYRIEYAKFMATTVSLFIQSGNQTRASLVYNGDYNGDQLAANDLIYIPNNAASELNFKTLQSISDFDGNGTKDTVRVTGAQQAAALETFINGNPYLAENRGKYAERNGFLLPWLTTMDLSVQQEFFLKLGTRRHRLQVRADVYNFANLINNKWGVGDSPLNVTPLKVEGKATDQNGGTIQQVSFGSINSKGQYAAPSQVLQPRASLADVWQLQLGVRYIFE